MRAHPSATTGRAPWGAGPQAGAMAVGALVLALVGCTPSTPTGQDPTNPTDPSPNRCEPPQTRARRLSLGEVERSLRDLFPTVSLGATGLPTDPRPAEFDNDVDALQPSALWVEGMHRVAIRAADAVVTGADAAVGCDVSDAACAEGYVQALAERAFRRPLDVDERADVHSFFAEAPGVSDARVGLTLAIEYVLQSPGFLYRVDAVDPADATRVDALSFATRLAFFVWGSLPDDELRRAAIAGELESEAQVEAQVRRMLADPRAAAASLAFHAQWLDFERLDRTVKAADDGFTDELRRGFALEQERLITDTLFANNASITTLLSTRAAHLTPATAAFYGVDSADLSAPVELGAERGGLLRRGGFLASHAHPRHPSPVQRGVFVLDRLLCTELGVPPANADVSPPVPSEEAALQTNREVVEERTMTGSCAGCHAMINPIGYTFESYDTLGRVRSHDGGLPVDDNGSLFGDPVHGADELVARLQGDGEVDRCGVRKLLTQAWGDLDVGFNDCLVDDVLAKAPARGVRDLIAAIATHKSFRAAEVTQ